MSGGIPRSMGELRGLSTLDLGRNRLSGEIPSSLRYITFLETVDLANKGLTGNTPPWIGKAFTSLRILSLRANNLSGELPLALLNLSCSQILDLAEYQLNGSIPATFGGLCGGPLVLKFSDDDSNNGRNNDGSYGGRKDEADEGIGFIDKWLYLSIGLGYAVGLLLSYLTFAIKRSWGGVYFAFVDMIVDRLSSSTNQQNRPISISRRLLCRLATLSSSSSHESAPATGSSKTHDSSKNPFTHFVESSSPRRFDLPRNLLVSSSTRVGKFLFSKSKVARRGQDVYLAGTVMLIFGMGEAKMDEDQLT
ncbi:hypothetical protein GH714_018159 [Hevea brasiliensis]|uniref:Uncharacterized protein n=1 Tax=Hevea brasiliensis TaxID=3981 RepID=A0A6A6N0U7_HEVBR|nr:hypothetical protein GH714_018159 [Hevea brasiliensis]